MKLALDGGAITTGASRDLPTPPLVSVSNPRERDASYGNRGHVLRLFEAVRPVWVDTPATEDEGRLARTAVVQHGRAPDGNCVSVYENREDARTMQCEREFTWRSLTASLDFHT